MNNEECPEMDRPINVIHNYETGPQDELEDKTIAIVDSSSRLEDDGDI